MKFKVVFGIIVGAFLIGVFIPICLSFLPPATPINTSKETEQPIIKPNYSEENGYAVMLVPDLFFSSKEDAIACLSELKANHKPGVVCFDGTLGDGVLDKGVKISVLNIDDNFAHVEVLSGSNTALKGYITTSRQ